MRKVALFSLTSQPLSERWLLRVQTDANEMKKDTKIEVVASKAQGGPATLMEMAEYCRSWLAKTESPFASRTFLVADDDSERTHSVIIVNLVPSFIQHKGAKEGKWKEEDVIEGHMRVHPQRCLELAGIFDSDTQGIDEYVDPTWQDPGHIMPRIPFESMEPSVGPWTVYSPETNTYTQVDGPP